MADQLPVVPRPAASLILVRDASRLEVLVGRRADDMPAFPGATAFPGGKIEPQDRAWPGAADHPPRAAAFAALRETFEETGLLVCGCGLGPPAGAEVSEARAAVEEGRLGFPDLLMRWGRQLDPDRLTPFARFVTPASYPYRFDTWFFLAAASAAEAEATLVCAEFEALRWASPADLLDDPLVRLPNPTRANLERLRPSRTAAEALHMARRTGIIEGTGPELAGRRL